MTKKQCQRPRHADMLTTMPQTHMAKHCQQPHPENWFGQGWHRLWESLSIGTPPTSARMYGTCHHHALLTEGPGHHKPCAGGPQHLSHMGCFQVVQKVFYSVDINIAAAGGQTHTLGSRPAAQPCGSEPTQHGPHKVRTRSENSQPAKDYPHVPQAVQT